MFLYLANDRLGCGTKSKFEILYSGYKNLMYYTANRISAQQQRCGGRGASGFLKVIEILGYHFSHQGVTKRVAARHLLPST